MCTDVEHQELQAQEAYSGLFKTDAMHNTRRKRRTRLRKLGLVRLQQTCVECTQECLQQGVHLARFQTPARVQYTSSAARPASAHQERQHAPGHVCKYYVHHGIKLVCSFIHRPRVSINVSCHVRGNGARVAPSVHTRQAQDGAGTATKTASCARVSVCAVCCLVQVKQSVLPYKPNRAL